MAPPPIPFFRGRTVSVAEADSLLVFRPRGEHRFSSPPGTSVLYLPTATTLSIEAEPMAQDGWSQLRCRGHFDRVSRPEAVILAPLDARDAAALVEVLSARLGLPRTPRGVHPWDLTRGGLANGEYVTIVGRQGPPAHFESPDFEGCKLHGEVCERIAREPGKLYHVTGFFQRGTSDPRVVGYRGPSILVTHLRPEPSGPAVERPVYSPPDSPTRHGTTAWLGTTDQGAYTQRALISLPHPRTRVAAVIDGIEPREGGDHAALAAQLALATLLRDPHYLPLLDVDVEPPPSVDRDLAAWVAWLVDRRPLPTDPGALVAALVRQLGVVFDAFALRRTGLSASGVVAVVRDGEASLLRTGYGGAYLVSEGRVTTVLEPDVLGLDPGFAEALAQQPALAVHSWTMTSCFSEQGPSRATAPTKVALQRGDRLILVAGPEVLQALAEDPARVARCAEDPALALAHPTEAMQRGGFAVMAVDPDPT